MAVYANIFFLLSLLPLLSSHHIHARESQFFNKIPTNNNNNNSIDILKEAQAIPPKQEDPSNKPDQDPNFIPENKNGSYGHESSQLPPSATKPTTTTTNLPYNNQPNEFLPKYLPKNYNTEAYVTEPEGYRPAQETNSNNYYNTADNAYYQNQKHGSPVTSAAANGGNYYQNYGGNSYNGQQQGVNEFTLAEKGYTTNEGGLNYYTGGNVNNVVDKQGMSDTRFLENGKYFNDIHLDKNNRYPFGNTRGAGDQYSKNGGYYGNNENYYDSNKYSSDGFQNQDEQFQDDEGLP